jgi:hypothetical protein
MLHSAECQKAKQYRKQHGARHKRHDATSRYAGYRAFFIVMLTVVALHPTFRFSYFTDQRYLSQLIFSRLTEIDEIIMDSLGRDYFQVAML